MLLDDDDMGAIIDALGAGDTAVIGADSLPVIFTPARTVAVEDGTLATTAPYAIASAAAVAALTLTAGNGGSILTIAGVDYRVLAIDPDGLAATLTLAEVD